MEWLKKHFSEYFIKETLEDITSLGGITVYCTLTLFSFFADFQTGSRLLLMLFLCYIITATIKSIYKKQRPKQESYKNLIEKIHSRSFPSLHAMRTTILAATFAQLIDNKIATLFLILLIIIVSWTRTQLKKHYITDIIGGIVFGLTIFVFVNWLS